MCSAAPSSKSLYLGRWAGRRGAHMRMRKHHMRHAHAPGWCVAQYAQVRVRVRFRVRVRVRVRGGVSVRARVRVRVKV